MKQCPACSHPKPFAEFTKNRQNSDGYATYCKEHHRAKIRKWRKENPQKVLQTQSKWRKNRRLKAEKAQAAQMAMALKTNASSSGGISEK